MVSRAINDKFDAWYRKELNFPSLKDSENYGATYHSSNLSLIPFKAMRLLVQITNVVFT